MMNNGWQQFLALCLKCHSSHELDKLFQLFFTFEERDSLATRCLLIHELLKGERTQREIAKYLNISIAKITRGSNALKILDSKTKNQLMKIIKEM